MAPRKVSKRWYLHEHIKTPEEIKAYVEEMEEEDYDAALKKLDRLWGSKLGTADDQEFDVLVTLIEAYEDKHYPMGSRPAKRKKAKK